MCSACVHTIEGSPILDSDLCGMRDGRRPALKFYETKVIAYALKLRGLRFDLHLNARWFQGGRPLDPAM